jgi:imidazolonepropionase-like amidohydrolase
VAPAKEVAAPADARVVDARGRWILPGLIDMHVHRAGQPDIVPFALYVANGVTSIRDILRIPTIIPPKKSSAG